MILLYQIFCGPLLFFQIKVVFLPSYFALFFISPCILPSNFALALALCFALVCRAKQRARARAKFEGKIHGEMNQRAKIDFALALFFCWHFEGKKRGQGQNFRAKKGKGKTLRAKIQQQKTRAKIRARERTRIKFIWKIDANVTTDAFKLML